MDCLGDIYLHLCYKNQNLLFHFRRKQKFITGCMQMKADSGDHQTL